MIRCRPTSAKSSCRSSAKGRSTKTCWRIRPTESRRGCARKATATRRPRTRGSNRAASCSSPSTSSAVLSIASIASRSSATPSVPLVRVRAGAAAARRRAVFTGEARRRPRRRSRSCTIAAGLSRPRRGRPKSRSARRRAAAVVPLRVRIVISEGPRTLVSAVRLQGDTVGTEAAWKEGLGLQPGRPYVDRQLVLDRDALQLQYANLGYPDRDRRCRSRLQQRSDDGRADVHRAPGSAHRRRSRPHRRQRAHERGDDRARGADQARRSAQRVGQDREPPPARGARPVPPRPDHRARSWRRGQARRAGHGRRIAGDDGRVRRRRRGTAARRPERRRRRRPSERLDVAPRGSFEISRRNVFGKNRSVSLFTSVSVHLQNPDVFDENGESGGGRCRPASPSIACSAPIASRGCSGRPPTRSSPARSSNRRAPASTLRVGR